LRRLKKTVESLKKAPLKLKAPNCWMKQIFIVIRRRFAL